MHKLSKSVHAEKTRNTKQLELYFAQQKIEGCCFMQINVSPHRVKFSGVFLKLTNIYIVTESMIFIVLELFT